MRVTIHQPEHMPWLGFFHKIMMADTYVILDNVQFRKDYFQNRNQIRTASVKAWITVPLKDRNKIQLIKDVEISYDHNWQKKYLNLITQNYAKSRFYDRYFPDLVSILKKEHKRLCELNIEMIEFLSDRLGLSTKMVRASELNISPCKGGTTVNLNICKALGADVYISGISGKDYLDEGIFRKNDIDVVYQEFHHPIYEQLYEPFIPCMSVVDLLFNHGDKSVEIIGGIGVPVLEEVFK